MSTRTEGKVQAWGNSLAIRIPATMARAAHLSLGQPVAIEFVEGGLLLKRQGRAQLSLAQKLKSFDPAVHGGEAMATGRVGVEEF